MRVIHAQSCGSDGHAKIHSYPKEGPGSSFVSLTLHGCGEEKSTERQSPRHRKKKTDRGKEIDPREETSLRTKGSSVCYKRM